MHKGSVTATSLGLGSGSEFTVRLPAVTEFPQPSNMEIDPVRSQTMAHRLLVVDDNRESAITLAMLLRLEGHEVWVAHDGRTALELAKAHSPDMVFLDIGMPGMDGYEVAREIRKIPEAEKSVLTAVTGWGQQEHRRRTAEAGFNHHLVKPIDLKVVESLLESLTD
jgi:CheY-like chemotaxis protein